MEDVKCEPVIKQNGAQLLKERSTKYCENRDERVTGTEDGKIHRG